MVPWASILHPRKTMGFPTFWRNWVFCVISWVFVKFREDVPDPGLYKFWVSLSEQLCLWSRFARRVWAFDVSSLARCWIKIFVSCFLFLSIGSKVKLANNLFPPFSSHRIYFEITHFYSQLIPTRQSVSSCYFSHILSSCPLFLMVVQHGNCQNIYLYVFLHVLVHTLLCNYN